MNTNENAHPSVAALEQAQVGNVLADGYSHDHCTSNPVAGQLKIADFLGAGQKNAVPLRHLEMLTGFDGRTVRRMIANERLGGAPILADNLTGYFLPASENERQRCVRSMKHRAQEIQRAAAAIAAAEVHEGFRPAPSSANSATEQERIPGWLDG